MRHGVNMRLDLLDQALGFEALDDQLARGEAEHAVQFENCRAEFRARRDALRELGIGIEQKLRVGAQDIDHGEAVAPAHLEIVEVVRGRDLDGARALLGIGIFIGDDGDAAADERKDRVLADKRFVALVLGMDGDGGVAEHRLGPRRGDDDVARLVVGIEGRPLDRIAQVPEMALGFDLLDFEIGNRGEQLGIPVDQALVLVDEPGPVEIDEDLAHRARQPVVHGEAEPRPVAGAAEPLELADNGVARLFFPLPHAANERLAAHGAAPGLLPLHELALDHHLGGDAGVIGAGLPQARRARACARTAPARLAACC